MLLKLLAFVYIFSRSFQQFSPAHIFRSESHEALLVIFFARSAFISASTFYQEVLEEFRNFRAFVLRSNKLNCEYL